MARIEHIESGRVETLRAWHMVGRAASCDLQLPSPRVSAQHAAIRWMGSGWTVRDLGSTNGTTVNGHPLAAGEELTLSRGAALGFGQEEPSWRVLSVDAPTPMALPVSGGPAQELVHEVIALPSPERPAANVLRRGLAWVLERDGEVIEVRDGELVQVAGQAYRLLLPEAAAAATEDHRAPNLGELTLRFRVSLDEEYVELELSGPRGVINLGARAHHYLLLTLARRRLSDRDEGFEALDEGWLTQAELAQMLRMDDSTVYVHISRARRQVVGAGVLGGNDVVERRTGTGQLRLGAANLEVHRI